jgi:hypothetical protein
MIPLARQLQSLQEAFLLTLDGRSEFQFERRSPGLTLRMACFGTRAFVVLPREYPYLVELWLRHAELGLATWAQDQYPVKHPIRRSLRARITLFRLRRNLL